MNSAVSMWRENSTVLTLINNNDDDNNNERVILFCEDLVEMVA